MKPQPAVALPNTALILPISMILLVGCGSGAGTVPDDSGPGVDSAQDTDSAPGDSAGSPDTWTNFGASFFETYCVSCHDSGDKDFRTYADVVTWSETIRCGVASERPDGCTGSPSPEQFPVGNGAMPTAEERDRIVAWIDAGMAE